MDHSDKVEGILEEKPSQVVLAPASALRTFAAIGSNAKGVFWEVDGPAVCGPYFDLGEIQSDHTVIRTVGPWQEMLDAAKTMPVGFAQAAADAFGKGERWLCIPAKIALALVRPMETDLWGNWHAHSDWSAPYITATYAIAQSEALSSSQPARSEVSP